MNGLTGKSIIVTGGGSGIGQAACRLLGEGGALVTIADLNEAGGRATAEEIEAAGIGKAQFVHTDVSNEDDVKAMVAAAVSAYGKLDGAINAAGVPQHGKPMHEVTADEFDFVCGINLRGMFLCVKYQVQAMLEKGGAIVAIASTAGVTGVPNSSEYCASKSGVMGLVRGVSVDYADKGIRINAVLPGGTWTPMVQRSLEQDPGLQKVVDTFPMKRFAQPVEIASGAVWMVSDQASYCTGAMLSIDGALSVI